MHFCVKCRPIMHCFTDVQSSLSDEELLTSMEKMYETEYAPKFPGVKPISAVELCALVDGPVELRPLLVDCRTAAERAVSIIPSAISKERFEELLLCPAGVGDRSIVVYCTIGYRSGLYAVELQRRFTVLRVFNLRGSVLAWAHAKREFVDISRAPLPVLTRRVHVFAPRWNLVPRDYEGVVFGLLSGLKAFLNSRLVQST